MSVQTASRPLRDRIAFAAALALAAALYALSLHIAEVSPARLWEGLPRLMNWASRAWPPDFSEWYTLVLRAAETAAMATVGTSFGALLAIPVCLLAARNVTTSRLVRGAAHALLNALRGVDSFIFALIFVAAVGLGPFAGVLGLALHSAGSIAKLWSETLETAAPGPLEAVSMSGASRLKVVRFALLPDVMPGLASTILYMWEWSLRASTVLGVVGAGGIGQELKNSVDLLQFDRVFAILILILVMVSLVDATSAYLRRRLL